MHAPGAYGDHITGPALFAAVLAGLYERQRTGRGGLVETSLLQAASWIVGPELAVFSMIGRVNAVAHRSEAPTPLVNSYRTADGVWIFLTGVEAMRHSRRSAHRSDSQSSPRTHGLWTHDRSARTVAS